MHACTVQVDVYDGTAEHLRSLHLDQDSLTKAIIGTIGDIDSYQLPDAKGYTAFMRHLLRVGDEERQARREQILGTTLKDFRCRPVPLQPPLCTHSLHARMPSSLNNSACTAAMGSSDCSPSACLHACG